jgi:PAS domain S-box-containing protein
MPGEGLGSLLDVVVEACLVVGFDGRIVGLNCAAERMFGWPPGEAVGADMGRLLFSEDRVSAYRAVLDGSMAGATRSLLGGRAELVAVHRDGHEVPIELAVSVIDAGEGPQFAILMLDISERKELEARSRRSEAVITSSGDAIWSGSLNGTIESWNPAAERLFGYSENEIVGRSAALLRPADELGDFTREHGAVAGGDSVLLQTSGRRKDGSPVDVAITLSPLRDEAGEVVGVVSVVRDVSGESRTAARLAEAQSRFAGAFEAASTGMALVALDGGFLAVNPALCELLARDADTLLASSMGEVTHVEDLAASRKHSASALVGETDSCQHSKRFLLPDGGIVWGLLTVTIVRDAAGEPLHFVAQIQDITARKTSEGELRRYAAHLEALSEQDPLTGLPNRRAFRAAAAEELRVLALGGEPWSLLVAEVNGEEPAVVAATEVLARASRGADLVAYLGHGELGVLLRSVDDVGASAIAARIHEALGERRIRTSHAMAKTGDTVDGLLQRVRSGLPEADESVIATGIGRTGARVRRLLELARGQLDMPVSFLSRLEGDSYVFAYFAGEPERFGVKEGDAIPLSVTHCQRMLDGRIGSVVTDLAANPETRDLDLSRRLGLRAYAGVPVRLRSGEIYGTLCAVDTRPHPALGEGHVELLGFLSDLAAELIEDETEQQGVRRVEARATGVRTLLIALEARDFYTSEHSKQVVELAAAVARRLGLDQEATRDVEQVALLHDIGKVGIPDAILQKQGPLDDQEWQLMRQHPIVGEHIIAGTPGLSHLAPAMRAEHEHWDGGGYPDGLVGEEIPLASRITLACDALNAMTNDRPYRPAMSLQRAQEELRAGAGTQFDPQTIEALLAEVKPATGPPPGGTPASSVLRAGARRQTAREVSRSERFGRRHPLLPATGA